MFGLGVGELVLILVVCVLLFGSKKIPALARGVGQAINEFKKTRESSECNEEENTEIKKKKT